MQAPARDRGEILWTRCGIQGGQLRAQPHVVHWLNAGLRARAVEAFQTVVTEGLDHGQLYPDRIQVARWVIPGGCGSKRHIRINASL